MAKRTVVFAETLYDGRALRQNVSVVVEGDTIVEVVDRKLKASFSGVVTPAFVDAHSHIGMARYGEPGREEEVNDHTDQFLPLADPLNSVYFDDGALAEAVDFGVLYSCIVPGSGNLLGGKAMVIRTFAPDRRSALVKDYGYKMALGYNPRSTTEWKGTRPNTRMAAYVMIEKRFDQVLQKKAKADLAQARKRKELEDKAKEKQLTAAAVAAETALLEQEAALELDAEDLALLDILVQKRPVKVHVHKEDDVVYLIGLVQKYGLNVTADHLGDVHRREIFAELAKHDIPIVYGPLGSFPYKVELKHDDYRNAGVLLASGAFFGLMTDHPVIMTPMLRDSLKYFLIAGMKPEEALGVITLRNATVLGLQDRLGSIEAGKLASLVVWDRDPLHLAAFPQTVLAEGRVVRRDGKRAPGLALQGRTAQ
jgi:imidazolonepropionase-like amidohydrolase